MSYSSDIAAYCGWRAESATDAQDAAAEVFLTAWRRLDELPDGDAARVWLYATARRVIANQQRSSRRRVALYEWPAFDASAGVAQQPPFTGREEYLAAVRADVGGATLRRITDAMTGLTTRRLGDGSTAYRGTVAAGVIARESGVKEGRPVRVLPFGHVAHDEAADPAAPLDTAVAEGADGSIRELTVTWAAGATAWTYRLAYRDLGETPDLVAPADARPLRRPR